MHDPPILAYVESCLPGTKGIDRLRLALELDLALELPDEGDLDLEPYREAGARIASIQAYRLHDEHALNREPSRRREGAKHVHAAMELAARSGCRRVVTICCYGHDLADQPFERCVDFYAALESRARELGVRLMIEPLSPLRTSAMIDPHEIARLVDTLDSPEVFSILLDTGHLADSGVELDPFFEAWDRPIEELQLRGPGSAPPTPEMPTERWLASLPGPTPVLSVEHRLPIDRPGVEALVASLRERGLDART